MTRLLVALLLLTACDRCAPRPERIAVVEEAEGLSLKVSDPAGRWRTLRALPSQARSVQVSPDGHSVAWVQDVTTDGQTVMEGWSWPASAIRPTKLGELGLRKVDAPGLAIDDGGRTAWVDRAGVLQVWPKSPALGEGWSPTMSAGTLAWFDADGGCTRTRGLSLATPLCDPVALVLGLRAGRVVAATSTTLFLLDDSSTRHWPLDEPQAAVLSAEGRIAVVHRARQGRVPVDALSVVTDAAPTLVLQRPLIVSVDWDSEETLFVVQKSTRQDIYELMLAHAPAEFGGEAASGTAVRVTLDDRESPVEGLPENAVRLLRRAR